MDRDNLLEQIIKLEVQLEEFETNPIEGEEIVLPDFGVGIVSFQDETVTKVTFNGDEKTFNASTVDETFFNLPKKEKLESELNKIQRSIDAIPPVEELLKKLVNDKWSQWDKYEDFYLNDLAYQLVNYPRVSVSDDEKIIIEQIKTQLSLQDWNKLPVYIADVHFGRKPVFIDDKDGQERETIKTKVKKERLQQRLNNTASIIIKIVEEENRQIEINATERKVQELLETDYLGAKNQYIQLGLGSCISEERFLEKSEQFVRRWFEETKKDGENTPDPEQLSAISSRHKNVQVVARAGSGKTSTINNRARFLIDHCNVDPSRILMLAFNKKAVETMEERLEESIGKERLPFIMTFHALAWAIVHPKDTLIFDDPGADTESLSRAVQTFIDERIRGGGIPAYRIRKIMKAQFEGEWNAIVGGGYNLSKEDMLSYRRAIKKITLKDGQVVKTEEDRIIANTLFEHDIEYDYYRGGWLNGKIKTGPYFIAKALNDITIVIEVIDPLSGETDSRRHKDYWENSRGYNYFPIRSDIISRDNPDMLELLKGLFNSAGKLFNKLSEDEIWRRIKDRVIDGFTETVVNFIGRCRKCEITPDELAVMIRKHVPIKDEERWFLNVALDFYRIYLKRLSDFEKDDFDGLLSTAADYVKSGKIVFKRYGRKGSFKDLSFILIDEYQDFSLLFDNFLSAIREQCPDACVFCVGDDWQAINSFAGADVKFFHEFASRYEDSNKYHVSTNYRSRPEIVDSGNGVMRRYQTEKVIRANKPKGGTVRVGYSNQIELYPHEIELYQNCPWNTNWLASIVRLVQAFLNEDKTVAILSRTNYEIIGLEKYLRSLFPKRSEDDQRIFVSTTHKYKGKEQDAVIIVDAEAGKYPIINPNWIFFRIFGDTIHKLIEDDRRLFYVAVTRARQDLVLLTTPDEESPFLEDLIDHVVCENITWSSVAPIKPTDLSNEANQVKVVVSNQAGYKMYPPPTMKIKELLKLDGFKYSNDGSWHRFYSMSDNIMSEIMQGRWADEADHIVISIVNAEGSLIAQYTIENDEAKDTFA